METVKPEIHITEKKSLEVIAAAADEKLKDQFERSVRRPIMDILRNVFPFAHEVRKGSEAKIVPGSGLELLASAMGRFEVEFFNHHYPRVFLHLEGKKPAFQTATPEEIAFLNHAHKWHWPLDPENEEFRSLAWVYGATFGRDLAHELTLFATSVFTEEQEGGNNG